MTAYNQPGHTRKPKEYTRVTVYCPICLTPLIANRIKDAPHFCPLCHNIPVWHYADDEYYKRRNDELRIGHKR